MSHSSIHIEPPLIARREPEADCPPAAFPSRIPRFEPRARASRGARGAVARVGLVAVGLAVAAALTWLGAELRWLPLLG